MKTLDILSLPKTESSLSIVKSYLQSPISLEDYELVFLFMLEIELGLGIYENVILEAEDYITHKANQDSPKFYKLFEYLFDASFELGDLNRCYFYLEELKKHVPVLEEYKVLERKILIAKKINEPYIEYIRQLVYQPTPKEIKLKYAEELLDYYINEKMFIEAEQYLKELEKLAQAKFYKKELQIIEGLGDRPRLLKKAEEYKKDPNGEIAAILKLLEIYSEEENTHKITILDTEGEQVFESKGTLEERKAFAKILMAYYKKISNRQSFDYYEEKFREIKKEENKLVKEAKKEKEKRITKIEAELTTAAPKEERPVLSSKEQREYISRFIEIFEFSETINAKFALRDFFRTLFIFTEKYLPASDYVIYLDDSRLFHYKKERLYEKRIVPEIVKRTIVGDILKYKDPVFSHPLDLAKTTDITTQLMYESEIKYLYGFPIGEHGVFLAYFSEKITDPEKYYDLVKLLSVICFAKISREDKISLFRKENFFLTNILKSKLIPIRTVSETKTIYNEAAQKLLNMGENDYIDLFYQELKPSFTREYRDTIKRLFSKPDQYAELKYQYKNKHIEERLTSILDDEQIKVVSIFKDITEEVIQMETGALMQITDPETKIYNLTYLRKQMLDLLEDKVTFILIELNLDNRYLYGPDVTETYFKEFIKITDDFFVDGTCYRTDFNEIMVTLPFNDVRAVTNICNSYLEMLDNYQVLSNSYEPFKVKMGTLRYPVETKQRNIDKLLRFTEIAKEIAKRSKVKHVHHFTNKDYQDDVFEQSMLVYLNEALENKNMVLAFRQVIDLDKNAVWQYESQLSIPDLQFESNYLVSLAKKRNRIVDLEKFHIKKLLDFLVKLNQKTSYLIKITIPISEETFSDPGFNEFLVKELKARDIPMFYVRLKLELSKTKANQYGHKINDLLNKGISLDTDSLEMVLTYPLNALYVDFSSPGIKWQSYHKELKKFLEEFHVALVAENVNSKDDLETVKRIGIKYAEGQVYREITDDELLRRISNYAENQGKNDNESEN